MGILHGQGLDINAPRPVDGLWLAATAIGRLDWELLPRLGVVIDFGGVLPFERDDFILDQLGTVNQTTLVHQPAPVEARGGLGLEARF